MRKLVILKSLLDFIWITVCIPLSILAVFFSVYIFIDSNIINVVRSNNLSIDEPTIWSKTIVVIAVVMLLAMLYCVYLFRKTIRYFQKGKPFDVYVISNYKTIGNILVLVGVISAIMVFVIRLEFRSSLIFSFGISPNLFMVGLGLFFMVLSETFKVAKTAKDENELTI